MDKFLTTTLRNISWFKEINDQGYLILKPAFQRNPVWVERQKSFLIDSILNGYPIPEIYIQENTDEFGKTEYVIVDGQQRLRSVLEFLNGDFCINKKESPIFNGAYFKDLSKEQKINFYSYKFVVRSLPLLNDSELREIFQRLNRNVVTLNPQELRQATYGGPFIKMVNILAINDVWNDMGLFSANDIRRMRNVEFISELVVLYLKGIQNKKDKLDKYYEEFESFFTEEDVIPVRTLFKKIFQELSPVSDIIKHSRWRNRTDFYSLFGVMIKCEKKIPFSNEMKESFKNFLEEFSNQVNNILALEPDEISDYSNNLQEYAKGIRASTDYGARLLRENALYSELRNVVAIN